MYYDFKYIEYIGDNIFKIMVTKFLYCPFNSWKGFQIDKLDDLINIDISMEYLIYHKNEFYFIKYCTFDSDEFKKCQQGDQKIYSIKFDNNVFNFIELKDELIDIFDIDYNENTDFGYRVKNKKDRESIKNNEKIRREYGYLNFINKLYESCKEKYKLVKNDKIEVDNDLIKNNLIYKFLIQPFLDQPLFKKYDNKILDGFTTEYKVFLWYFFYNKETKYKFTLSLVESYILKSDKYKYLYIKKYPKYKKDILYRELSFRAICCGSGNYFFFHNKKKEWIDLDEEQLKLKMHIFCLNCEKRLEKWEKFENDYCFNCNNNFNY